MITKKIVHKYIYIHGHQPNYISYPACLRARIKKEWEEERRERAEKIKQADKITPIKESEKPETFFSRFEEVMRLAEIEEGEWTMRLAPLFVGRHADINHDHVAKEMKIDYFSLKEAFVTTAGSPLLIVEGST